ncbi:MAG: efflux RND transporter periplasmic adaptor subunit [Phormidesmis sp.]
MNSESVYSSTSEPINASKPSAISSAERGIDILKRQKPWVRYSLLGAVGLLLVAGSVASFRAIADSSSEAPPAEGRVLPVEATEIESVSSYAVPRVFTGEIVSLRSSSLGFERGGELVQVMVDEGREVRAGEALAKLDTRNLETQRLQVEAQKAQAQAQLLELQNGARAEDVEIARAAVIDLEQQFELQETQKRRREYLFEQGAIAREQLDEFSFGANSLQARLDQARSQLEELLNGTRSEQLDAQIAVVNQLDAQLRDIDVNISKSTITAPFDGTISGRNADEGTVVGTGQSVLELVEATVPEARVGLPASVANQIQIGSSQTVRVNNQPYDANLVSILPTVDAATRTQTVVLALSPAAIGAIEPGQTARLTINETVQSDGFWLPSGALTQGIRGLWTCYVIVPASSYRTSEQNSEQASTQTAQNEDTFTETSPEPSSNSRSGKSRREGFVVEPRAVEIIQQESAGDDATARTRVLVRGTLEPGDQVVTSGVHRLVPGQQVSVVPAE